VVQLKCFCPECGAEGHHIVSCLGHIEKEEQLRGISTVRTFALVNCCNCKKRFIAEFDVRTSLYNDARSELSNPYSQKSIVLLGTNIATVPPPKEPYTHPAFPDKVSDFFVKIQRETHTITKVALVRAALELALKELGIEASNLYEAIQEAFKQGLITKSVAEWAHIVRKWGNKALHELEASEAEAQEAEEFLKIFLGLVFRIPYEVEKARS